MSDKDLQYYDGTDWQSLSEIAAAKLQATLPISDRLVDPTVTVDGADGVFTATAGAGKYQLLNSGFHLFDTAGTQSRFTSDGRFLVGTATSDEGYESTIRNARGDETGVVRYVTTHGNDSTSIWVDCIPAENTARIESTTNLNLVVAGSSMNLGTNFTVSTSGVERLRITDTDIKAADGYEPQGDMSLITRKYAESIQPVPIAQVASDWNEVDPADKAYIRNKPTSLSEFTNDLDGYDDTQIKSDITVEASRRAEADTVLQTNIESEASTRSTADAALTAVDVGLQTGITANSEDITTNRTHSDTRDDNIWTYLAEEAAAISENATNITGNTAAINQNEGSIAGNTVAIESNSAEIAKKPTVVTLSQDDYDALVDVDENTLYLIT